MAKGHPLSEGDGVGVRVEHEYATVVENGI
jgi:hypothetical protein